MKEETVTLASCRSSNLKVTRSRPEIKLTQWHLFLFSLKALVVMTDGISQDRVRRPALALRSHGVWVYALGIGRRYRRRQLRQIATNGRYVFTANFRSLSRVARRISGKICLSELSVFMFSERVHPV